MHPSFEQFVAALRDPSLRAGIGLVIGDADAAALLTSQEWANNYYYKWLALFPIAAAAAVASPATAPPVEPVAASVFASPPPPSAAPTVMLAPPAAMNWEQPPAASRIPTAAKTPLIIAGSVLAVVLLAVVAVSVVSTVITAAAKATPVALPAGHSASSPATAVADDPDTHGLSREEYELMEAVAAPSGHTIEQEVAHGTTDAQLRAEADIFESHLDDTCTTAQSHPPGFDSPSFKAAFVAGYAVQEHITTEQATVIFTALANYCRSLP